MAGSIEINSIQMLEVQVRKDTAQLVTQTLQQLLKSTPADLTPRAAWLEGLNIKAAYKAAPLQVMAALSAMIRATCEYLDANKTIQGADQLAEVTRFLIDQFPAMKLQEWALINYRIRMGYYERYGSQYKLYERLKGNEFARFARKHEEERAPLLEELHRPPPSRGATPDAVTRMYDHYQAVKVSNGQKLKQKLEAQQKQTEQTRQYAAQILKDNE